ncbi:MAG: thiamine phosphate synthase [Actinomycetota bacterium]|nr:thiamine phosphate synthase [Actinomycetota bacterium]
MSDLATAAAAVEGATVLQLRLKGAATEEVVERGRAFRDLCRRASVTFVVNDDVEAARLLEADGVHLGQTDAGADDALTAGLVLGLSAASVAEAEECERRGAAYIGAGPVWTTPTKPDASPPIGLDGLARIAAAVSVPVVAIGGIDVGNAADCMKTGAAGIAVVRAARDAGALRHAIDAALAAR